MFWWIVFLFFLLVGGYLVIRPTLAGMPQLKAFYAEADTFWAKLWALAWNSATVIWSYVLAVGGFLFNQIDTLATFAGDPQLKEQISNAFGADTKTLGYVMMGIAFITFASRMRSIVRGS